MMMSIYVTIDGFSYLITFINSLIASWYFISDCNKCFCRVIFCFGL